MIEHYNVIIYYYINSAASDCANYVINHVVNCTIRQISVELKFENMS